MLSRAELNAFKQQAFILACQLGLRPTARALGISEARIMKWASRDKWNISAIRPSATRAELSANVSQPISVMPKIMSQMADRTRLAMARTSLRAFEHSDTLSDEQLHELPRGVALEKHGRNAQMAHGWNQASANVAVQVNVPMPSEAEREEMRSIDAKLDAIAAKLKD